MAKGKYEQWLTEDGLLKLESWARDGLTNEQIANNIGISRKTLQEWIIKYGDISDTLKRNKEIVDIEVENALLKRALGYKYIETKTEKTDRGTKTTTITKEVIPDTIAQIFWLKNRRPEKWRDKVVDNQLSDNQQMSKLYEALENEENDT